MNLEEWSVAGRSFGVIFVWFLMAGEIYTTFAFLGASGWAFSRGGPALYILAFNTLGYVISFYTLPAIWHLGRRFGLQTQSDFFEKRYGSGVLGIFVSLLGVLFVVPYLQIQLTGVGIIVQVASYGQIPRNVSMLIAVSAVAAFVYLGGMRSIAWVSVLKDVLMVIAALSVGVYVPIHYFGGISPLFARLVETHPSHLTMPGATSTLGHSWYVSTVILSACGYFMWPHTFSTAFSAKSAKTLRRNAVVTPLYTMSLVFILIAGFATLLIEPSLKNGDMSLLTLARKTFSPWFLGVIGGAGALTAMVPAGIILLTASTLFAKNVIRPLAKVESDETVARIARITVFLLALLSFVLATHSSATLVALLLLGYAGISQLFPGVVLGLFWERTTKRAVTSGLVLGLLISGILMLSKHDPFHGFNAGFVALAANFVTVFCMSLTTAPQPNPFVVRINSADRQE